MKGYDKVFSKSRLILALTLTAFALGMTGCGGNEELLRQKDEEIASLQGKVSTLESQLNQEQAEAQKLHSQLQNELAEYKERNELLLDTINNMSVVTVSDAALFAFSSTTLTENGTSLLDKVAGVIKNHPDRQIWIEGHTDNVPIAMEFRDKYRSNWEFSSARAHAALHYLLTKHKLDPNRVAAVGYGMHRPVADNSTSEGRAKNRRVVIVIGPRYLRGA